MSKAEYVGLYIVLYALLHSADAVTAYVAIQQGVGAEANPLMTATNLFSLLVDPLNILIVVAGASIIYLSESNRERVAELISTGRVAVLTTPYILLLLKTVPVINNTMLLLGWGAPLSYLTTLGGNLFVSALVFAMLLALLLQAPVTHYLRRRYPS